MQRNEEGAHTPVRLEDRDNLLALDESPRLPRWDLIAGVLLAVCVAVASVAAPGAGVRAIKAAADALLAPAPADAATPLVDAQPAIAQQDRTLPPPPLNAPARQGMRAGVPGVAPLLLDLPVSVETTPPANSASGAAPMKAPIQIGEISILLNRRDAAGLDSSVDVFPVERRNCVDVSALSGAARAATAGARFMRLLALHGP